jgi:predicted RNase H-like HicB family nuclease
MDGYAIVVERAEDGHYGAWSPDIPGCVALGDTSDEAATEMREAIKLHVDLLRERGEPVPVPARRLSSTHSYDRDGFLSEFYPDAGDRAEVEGSRQPQSRKIRNASD